MNLRRDAGSTYMQWAKLHSTARHNLATSGMANFPLRDLGIEIGELEINGANAYGFEPMLQAIAQRYQVRQENVVSAMGTSLANYLALAAVTEAGDEILVEQPTYDPILGVARYLGLSVRRFPRRAENNFAVDVDELARNISSRTRAIVLCNLHNPTGAMTSEIVMAEIGKAAARCGAYVLVDEVYREMLFEAEPRSAFHIDPDRFIVTNSLTKAYGLSGLRCGWVLAPAELTQRMWHIHDIHAATYPYIPEWLSVVAFEKLPVITARMKAILDTNRALVRDFLQSRDDLDYFWPEHGTVVFPRLRHGDVDQLCETLRREAELAVVPGRFFEMPDRFRIGVGGSTVALRDALEQFGAGLNRYKESVQAGAGR